MSTTSAYLSVAEIDVDVVYKDIKNLHIGVYPPLGKVRVSAPLHLDDDQVRLALVQRLPWIKRKRSELEAAERQSVREMVNGESHYAWGRRYRLKVIENASVNRVSFDSGRTMILEARSRTDGNRRRKTLNDWYRSEMKARIPLLIDKWSPVVDVEVAEWGVKKMKTRWGSCNRLARRIWLNLELAKKRPECLEYVVVHEMVHILERLHNERFRDLLDDYMPNWRTYRDELNRAPLAHEDWSY